MKRSIIIAVLTLILISCNGNNTNKVSDTEIYVKMIKDIRPGVNIRDCIQFSDNRGSAHSLPGFPEYFMTRVNAGKKVTWMSAPDSDPVVQILEVNFKQNDHSTNILTEDYFRGKNGKVTAEVKKNGEVPHLSNQFYNMLVLIDNKVYTIDPILQFHAE